MNCKIEVVQGVGKNSGKEYTCVVVTLPDGRSVRVFDNNLLLAVYQNQYKTK